MQNDDQVLHAQQVKLGLIKHQITSCNGEITVNAVLLISNQNLDDLASLLLKPVIRKSNYSFNMRDQGRRKSIGKLRCTKTKMTARVRLLWEVRAAHLIEDWRKKGATLSPKYLTGREKPATVPAPTPIHTKKQGLIIALCGDFLIVNLTRMCTDCWRFSLFAPFSPLLSF